MMKIAIVKISQLQKGWDAPHIIRCVERGGDFQKAQDIETTLRNRKETGLLDLIDKAKSGVTK